MFSKLKLLFLSGFFISFSFFSLLLPNTTNAQSVNLGKVTGTVTWGTTNTSIYTNVKFVGDSTGFNYQTITTRGTNNTLTYDTGFNLPADTYTVTVYFVSADGTQGFAADSQSVTVTAGAATTANFDLSSSTGLVQGSLLVNGSPSNGYVQFCPASPAPCPVSPLNGYPFNSEYGPFSVFGSGYFGYNGFNIPLLPGTYQAHVVSSSGVDAGVVPITVTLGQVVNDSSLQFQINLGEISGTVLWGTQNTTIQGSVKFVGSTTGYTTSTILTRGTNNTMTYDSGFNLPADTYTLTLTLANADGSNAYTAGTQTIILGSGQSVAGNFDLSSSTGLVQGDLKINGVSSNGYIQFCPSAPAPCPVSPLNGYPFNPRYGPFMTFGRGYYGYDGFDVPLPPGNYQAHVVTSSGVDVGTVPITVTAGQLTNDSSLQFQFNIGRVSGAVKWGTNNVTIYSNIKFVGNNTGFTYQTITSPNGANHILSYDTGASLKADTYTVTVNVTSADGTNGYVASTQTVAVGAGQSVTANFDLSSSTGLVAGDLLVNGVSSNGYIQLCPAAPAQCPVSSLNGYPFNPAYGTFSVFGSGYFGYNGFNIPVLPGNYQAHVVTVAGVDVCTVPISVNIGQSVTLTNCTLPQSTPIPTYTLSGTVFVDINKNGTQDSGESGFNGATVTLSRAQATNYIYNPSAEVNTTAWNCYDNAAQCTLSRITNDSKFGTAAFRVQSTTASPSIRHRGRLSPASYGVSPGDHYCYSAYVKVNSGKVQLYVIWLNGGVNIQSGPWITSNTWTYTKLCSTVPAGTTQADVKMYFSSNADVYIDGIQFEANVTTPTSYFDGSFGTGYSWSGTANDSTSIRSASTSTATTNSSGVYSFSGLAADTYTAELTVPTGYTATTTNPTNVVVSTDTTQNFGIVSVTPTP